MAASYEPVTKRGERLLIRDATELNADEPADEVGEDAEDIETPAADIAFTSDDEDKRADMELDV